MPRNSTGPAGSAIAVSQRLALRFPYDNDGAGTRGSIRSVREGLVRARLFVLSYAPVLAIFALESGSSKGRIGFGVVTVLVVLDGVRITYGQRRKSGVPAKVTAIKDKGGEVSGYLASYILPFLIGPPTDAWQASAYGVYFAIAWIVYANSDLVLINPTLYVLGWRVIQGKRATGSQVLVLSRRPPGEGVEFDAVRFGSAYLHKQSARSEKMTPPTAESE